MDGMRNITAKERRAGWASYLASALVLASIFTLFLPILGVVDENGTLFSFSSRFLYFGGLQTLEQGGLTLSLAFHLNPYFLAVLALVCLSFLFALLGKNSPTRLLLSLLSLVLAAVALGFAPWFCLAANAPMPSDGLVYEYGFFVTEFLFVFAAIFLLVLWFSSRAFWRRKKQK